MKTLKVVLIALFTIALTVCMIACNDGRIGEDEQELKASEGLEFRSNGDGTCYVSGAGTCTDVDVVIPSVSPDGDKVTSISNHVFSYCDHVNSITFPKTLLFIMPQGLCGTPTLLVDERNPYLYSEGNCIIGKDTKTVILGCSSSVIPDDIKRIDHSAFAGCEELTDINIPTSVVSIGSQAFYGTELYKNKDNWEDGFLYIDGCLIKAPVGVEGVCEIKSGTRVIADDAFSPGGMFGVEPCLYSEVVLPDTLVSIGASAFTACPNLSRITIPKNVIHIGDFPFFQCSLDNIVVNSENSVYYSEGNCIIEKSTKTLLVGCKNSIIPSGVKSIAQHAFTAAELDEIKVPNGVTHIGAYAFYGAQLSSITLPQSLVEFDLTAFDACNKLENIYFEGTCEEWKSIKQNDSYVEMGITSIDGSIVARPVPPATVVHCTDGDVPLYE